MIRASLRFEKDRENIDNFEDLSKNSVCCSNLRGPSNDDTPSPPPHYFKNVLFPPTLLPYYDSLLHILLCFTLVLKNIDSFRGFIKKFSLFKPKNIQRNFLGVPPSPLLFQKNCLFVPPPPHPDLRSIIECLHQPSLSVSTAPGTGYCLHSRVQGCLIW